MMVRNEISPVMDGRTIARLRFQSASKFLAPLAGVIKLGLATSKNSGTPMGRAMSHMLTSCFVNRFPGLEIDPGKVKLSDGNLANPTDVEISRQGDTITVSWSTEILNPLNAYDDDLIMVCAYGIEARSAVLQEGEVVRKGGSALVILTDDLGTETVHLYLMVHTRDKKRFSRNMYLGTSAQNKE
ncbi:hypothetical protein H8B06_16225 [Sphingobacterium sp. DN00404]|uniref:Uncharacterized protein n=1 Tax=Sphingobacterium micropteri TaxID=2763501 RepID=A0ABR7YSS0_9SPHI|nr:DUF6266 family protein [Sphingobacterium micropteri]MBD1434380.1 hypothetical protein [Sphingobacterium micropteri]